MKDRIAYLDSLRGFAIIVVVIAHVFSYAFGLMSPIIVYFTQFIIPLFFAISGFLFYKPTGFADGKAVFAFLGKKAKTQLIPTAIFFCIFEIVFHYDFISDLGDWSKAGYWFTIALFYFFLIYCVFGYVLHKLKCKGWLIDVVMLLIGIFLLNSTTLLHKCGIDTSVDYFSITMLRRFLYFVVGTLIRKYYDQCLKLFANNLFVTVIVVTSLLGTIYQFNYDISPLGVRILDVVLSLAGIALSFAFFKTHEHTFDSSTRLGRSMQFVGRRTLDIYLLHFFIVPRNLQGIGEWFALHDNPFLFFILGLVLALVVTGGCLLISSIIRVSPFLAQHLFGAKPAKESGKQ